MEFENIIFQKTNQIVTIRLNRPKFYWEMKPQPHKAAMKIR
jgi:hypothetical protein